MTQSALWSFTALLTAFSAPACAATAQESFDSIVIRAQKANQTPAQGCDSGSCWRAWRIVNRQRAMLAIERTNQNGGLVNTACWTEPLDYVGSMNCMTTRGDNFTISPNNTAIWLNRIVKANSLAQPVLSLPSQTLDLNCSAPVVTKGDVYPGRNPVVATHVRVEQGTWSVGFKFADGTSVQRADQYNGGSLSAAKIAENNANAKQSAIAQWAGAHKRHADTIMFGSLYQDGTTAYRYVEVVASVLHPDNATVMVAYCAPIQAPAPQPPSPAPSPPPLLPPDSNPADPRDAAMTFTVTKNDVCDNCVTMSAAGKIVPETGNAFVNAVTAQKAQGKRVNILRLASPGGSVQPALSMGRLIRQWDIKTIVDGNCVSACAFAFMGGAPRNAAPMSLGVHQISFSDGAQMNGAVTAMASQASVSDLLIYAKEMGVDSEVISIATATPPNAMHYFGATELSALNLNTK